MALEAIEGSFDSDYYESAQLLENKRGGGKVTQIDQEELSAVDYKTQAFLTVFFGWFGLDDFYAGNYSRGLTKLVGICFVISAPIINSLQSVRLMELSKGKYADGDGKLIRQVVQLKKEEISPCDQQIVLILSVLLGWVGAHQFYTGKPLKGLLMLCSLGGLGIWNLINTYQLVTCGFKDGQGKTVCPDYIKIAYNVRP
jgi:TM2 domain-containing membrane protein YozV